MFKFIKIRKNSALVLALATIFTMYSIIGVQAYTVDDMKQDEVLESSAVEITQETEVIDSSAEEKLAQMKEDLIKSIEGEAKYIGEPQISTFATSRSLITHGSPLSSSVTISGNYWGAYREYDGNRIAVAFQFSSPSGDPNANLTVGMFGYGQQYFSQGYTTAYNQNQSYSFVANDITPITQSYRLRYEPNTYENLNVYVVAIPYYV